MTCSGHLYILLCFNVCFPLNPLTSLLQPDKKLKTFFKKIKQRHKQHNKQTDGRKKQQNVATEKNTATKKYIFIFQHIFKSLENHWQLKNMT